LNHAPSRRVGAVLARRVRSYLRRKNRAKVVLRNNASLLEIDVLNYGVNDLKKIA